MHIRTLNFGDLEIPEDKVIDFREGLPGFPQIHEFAVLEIEDVKPFQYLQSLGDPPIALLVINPFLIEPKYRFQLSQTDLEDLETSQSEGATIYSVATIPENPEEATLNLMAPIIINERARRGKQVILLDTEYSVRHPLLTKTNGPGAGSREL